MSFQDFNDAAPQMDFSPLPEKTKVWIVGKLRYGNSPTDRALTKSQKVGSDSEYLDFEFTVAHGEYRGRKIFDNWTVAGGKTDEKGNSMAWVITKSRIRAALNSAWGIPPKDESEDSKRKRTITGWAQLDGIGFAAELGVVPAKDGYQAKNKINRVIEPDDPDYGAIRTGNYVNAAPQAAAPAWGGGQQTSQQAPWGGQQPASYPQQQQYGGPPQGYQPPPPQPPQQWAGPPQGYQPPQPQQQWSAPPPPQAQPPYPQQQQWNAPPPNAGGYVAPSAPTGPVPGGWNGGAPAPQDPAAGTPGMPEWVAPKEGNDKPPF